MSLIEWIMRAHSFGHSVMPSKLIVFGQIIVVALDQWNVFNFWGAFWYPLLHDVEWSVRYLSNEFNLHESCVFHSFWDSKFIVFDLIVCSKVDGKNLLITGDLNANCYWSMNESYWLLMLLKWWFVWLDLTLSWWWLVIGWLFEGDFIWMIFVD